LTDALSNDNDRLLFDSALKATFRTMLHNYVYIELTLAFTGRLGKFTVTIDALGLG